MIHQSEKPYRVVCWETEDRQQGTPMRIEFDTLEAALEAFESERRAGRYRSGILLKWHKHSDGWDLVDRFPR